MPTAYRPSLGTSRNLSFKPQFTDPIDGKSLACTPVEYFGLDGNILTDRHASGFFYRHNGRVFFVTARHVLSGTDCFTDKHISPTGYRPERIRVRPAIYANESHRIYPPIELTVRDADDMPCWLEDPEFKTFRTDIAALEITHEDAGNIICINQGVNDELLTKVGFDVFALGYPFQNFSEPFMPIWRRGALASEPVLPIDDKPIFLCDITTSNGMSGAPIIQRWLGPAPVKVNGELTRDDLSVMTDRLIGVYGGRIERTEASDGAFVAYGWYANRIPVILGARAASNSESVNFHSGIQGGSTLYRG